MGNKIALSKVTSLDGASTPEWLPSSLLLSSTSVSSPSSCVCVSHSVCDSMDCILFPWNSPGKNTGEGCHFLLQGIFLTQGWHPGLLHHRWSLYRQSQQGLPLLRKMLKVSEKVRESQPRLDLFAGQEERHRHRGQTCGHNGGTRGRDKRKQWRWQVYTTVHEIDS